MLRKGGKRCSTRLRAAFRMIATEVGESAN